MTVTGTGNSSTAVPPVVTGPDGNGKVTVSIDTTGMRAGQYTVTIAGLLQKQSITFQVKDPNFG